MTLHSIAPHPWDPGTPRHVLELDDARSTRLELEPGFYRASWTAADGALRELPLEAVAGVETTLELDAGRRRADEDMATFEGGSVSFEFWAPPEGDAPAHPPRALTAEYAAFEIDRDFVSNEEFLAFLEEAGEPGEAEEWRTFVLPAGDLSLEEWGRRPAVQMTRDQARRFAAHHGARLPTYVEVVVASQGGPEPVWTPSEADYPRGLPLALPEEGEAQGIPAGRAAYLAFTKPVGGSAPLPGGIRDPLGNVSCWVEHPNLIESTEGSLRIGNMPMFAGSSWRIHEGASVAAVFGFSMFTMSGLRFGDVGLRCARSRVD